MKKNSFLLYFLFIATTNFWGQNGCTDPLASNFNPNATTNDGSCSYPITSISPVNSVILSDQVQETSGLILWNNDLYTHNDNADNTIYKLDKITGAILQNYPLAATSNIDWEDMSQDDSYIYIGDFGNNSTGNRSNLCIYKINKASLETTPEIDIINFAYANQTNFIAQTPNNNDFDCEAFVVTNTEILLFTKQWVSNQTSIYSVSKSPGTHVANLKTTLNVGGLITGATVKQEARLIALCGYSNMLQPFLYLIYDLGSDFNLANKRKIEITLPYHQMESITTANGIDYYLTNESFIVLPNFNNPQKLYNFSLSNYLSNYINTLATENVNLQDKTTLIYPNPTKDVLYIENSTDSNEDYQMVDVFGKTVQMGNIVDHKINLQYIENGVYFLKIGKLKKIYKIIKIQS